MQSNGDTKRSRLPAGSWLLAFPLAKLILHVATSSGYGYFRDEFYYLACSDHLAFGYVDQPPLSLLLLWVVKSLLGTSLAALRLAPALAGAAVVYLTGRMARQLGGGGLAQALAMLAVLISPVYLGLSHFYSMNALDLLFWSLAAYLLIAVLQQPRPRRWILLGVVLGLGLQNKISVLWLGSGFLLGLLLTNQRRLLKTPWPWIAAAIALLLFVPNLVWQALHGWPTVEFMRHAAGQKMVHTSLGEFFLGQFLTLGPSTILVWLPGLLWIFIAGQARALRPLGWVYVAIFLLLALGGSSRANYLAPAYTWLFAAGGLLIERCRARVGAYLAPIVLLLVVLPGLLTLPFGLPVLPVETYVSYAATLGVGPTTDEHHELGLLPQFYADMHGWDEIVETVADVYGSLPPGEQAQACILAPNYGVAGALDLLGRERGLPPALSGHNSYWDWGPRGCSGDIVIVVGFGREELAELFAEVDLAATTRCGYCMPYEDHRPIWVCRGLREPVSELLRRIRHFG